MQVPNKIVAELTELMNRAEDLTIDSNKTIFQLGKLHTEWEQWKERPADYMSINLENDGCCCEELQQLKQENENLKESVRKNKLKRKEATEKYQALKDFTNKKDLNRTNTLLEEANLDYFRMYERVEVLEKCLDKIEEIANTLECDCAIRDILEKIKEVKVNV